MQSEAIVKLQKTAQAANLQYQPDLRAWENAGKAEVPVLKHLEPNADASAGHLEDLHCPESPKLAFSWTARVERR